MRELGKYPFGEPVGLVQWRASGKRAAFVLGVYPSAFHASWYAPSDRLITPALSVADEPEPFWDGTGHQAALERFAQRVPAEVGSLRDAGANNGRAGRTLNDHYLSPLGLTRDEIWIADIQNYYLASEGQVHRLKKSYAPLAEAGLVPPAELIPRASRPSIDQLAVDRSPSLEDEWEEAAPEWLITLGEEPVKVLGLADLRDAEYGQPRKETVMGRDVFHLALVHTRQAGKHGRYSQDWHDRHREWLRRLSTTPPNWLDELRHAS